VTALSIVQAVCAAQALPIPQALFSATDAQTIEMRSLLNRELAILKKWPDTYWRKLMRDHTFTTTATEVQPSTSQPADLEYIIPSTSWDRTMSRPVLGPMDPQTWQAWKARPILTSVLYGYMLQGNDFYTAPTPPAGDTLAYTYISQYAVYAAGDTVPTKPYFTADTDTSIFDEVIVELGVTWRFLSQKKLECDQEKATWASLVQTAASRSKGLPVLSAAGPAWSALAGPYTPQFNFPGPA